jgi:hypothetical protein
MDRVTYVTDWELRAMFNDYGYMAMIESGELNYRLAANNHPSRPLAQVPHCTRSQMLSYLDKHGQELFRVHRYLLPDNTIGASGKPDPKRLYHDGQWYLVRSNPC